MMSIKYIDRLTQSMVLAYVFLKVEYVVIFCETNGKSETATKGGHAAHQNSEGIYMMDADLLLELYMSILCIYLKPKQMITFSSYCIYAVCCVSIKNILLKLSLFIYPHFKIKKRERQMDVEQSRSLYLAA